MEQLFLDIKQGGFGMFSVAFQEQALKLSWIVRLLKPGHQFWKVHLASQFIHPLQTVLRANVTMRNFHKFLKPGQGFHPFWFSIFRIWCSLNYTPLPYKDALLTFNSTLKVNKLYHKQFTDKLEHFELRTVNDWSVDIPTYSPEMLKMVSQKLFMKHTPRDWLRGPNTVNDTINTQIVDHPVSTKVIFDYLRYNKPVSLQPLWDKWDEDLNYPGIAAHWHSITCKALQFTEIKMRSFYLKFINHAFATNILLKRIRILTSDLCTFCKQVPETRIHLFWDCIKVQPLWDKVIDFCKREISSTDNYCKVNCILLGFDNPLLNYVMLSCKHVIHTARLFNHPLDVNLVLGKIHRAMSIESIVFTRLPGQSPGCFYATWQAISKYPFAELSS